ncbi:Mitochondrial inner membrane protease subunit 2 [Channa argus]|uniref:Mitochondrial inner membrane protease subunit 2 n=1 Tax=Channa argus TaxID=215402 RepID=A0A6G1QU84_CHAAH|nr:Mitochondrial inner membrane protease subunit 2 [Channa argus]
MAVADLRSEDSGRPDEAVSRRQRCMAVAAAAGCSVMAQRATAGRRYLRAFVSGFFVAVPVTVTVLDRIAYLARVEGASMQPFLNPEGGSESDVVLLNRWSVRNYQIERGDIVSVM